MINKIAQSEADALTHWCVSSNLTNLFFLKGWVDRCLQVLICQANVLFSVRKRKRPYLSQDINYENLSYVKSKTLSPLCYLRIRTKEQIDSHDMRRDSFALSTIIVSLFTALPQLERSLSSIPTVKSNLHQVSQNFSMQNIPREHKRWSP